MNRTRQLLWRAQEPLALKDYLEIPHSVNDGKHKCRITYGAEIVNIEWEKYQPRTIGSLRVVKADGLDYAHKYKDRQALNSLYDQRGSCDDVLIMRQGFITDTSYANIALFDGAGWYTPEHPLLAGTQRAYLLDQEIIKPRAIRADDIPAYVHLRLFNAMLPWEEGPTLEIERLFFE
ncbi:4-amino-4-deoxychorismate lyase [Persicitalea jodogahamensis]|uniref:4-amino-4-deoxychorismate lyase n=2 Tax=Persicitalea jodogahamensis TaxID=402147 RepID=A0A8J3D3X0_9BACT|nr:4-amino-4-deoxychorismate lyase [Persicitalea jodogahamensis]